MTLEFTTTACNRPSLLNKTYQSYSKNLNGVDFRASTLYLNIDPAPNTKNLDLVEKIARNYFGTVIVNYPTAPNFAKAVKWCFSQPKGPYFFHLEDDWVLRHPVNIERMLDKLNGSTLQCVLNKKLTPVEQKQVSEPTFVPSIFSTSHLREYLPHMTDDLNPEYQMKLLFRKKVQNLHLSKSVSMNPKIELSRDIGRIWLSRNRLTRNYDKPGKWSPWITWRKKGRIQES